MDKATEIKKIWGLAKSPELKLTDEELHLIVSANTGKDSIKKLNQRELASVTRKLLMLKDSARKSNRSRGSGNPATENQRKKVFYLAHQLGWEKTARVNGLCKKLFSIDNIDWLNYQQCSKLIEALKKMVERVENGDTEE